MNLRLPWLPVAVLNGFSQIFLVVNPTCGALVLLALGLGSPSLLAGGLLGNLAGTLSAWHMRYDRADIGAGLYGYNGALLGLLLTLLLGPAPLALLLTVIGARLAALFQAGWLRRVHRANWLPGYTLAFVVLGWVALGLLGVLDLVLPARQALALEANGAQLLAAVARGLGQVVFLESAAAGVCLWLALWIADRGAAGWALAGSVTGLVLAGWADGGITPAMLAGLAGYNTALVALALRHLPDARWMMLPGMALALAAQQAMTLLALPPLTLPFILVGWLAHRAHRSLRARAALNPG